MGLRLVAGCDGWARRQIETVGAIKDATQANLIKDPARRMLAWRAKQKSPRVRNSTTIGDSEMKKIKLRRAFGLSLLGALGLVAIFAVGAQAAQFLIENTKGEKVSLLATLTGAQEGAGYLLVAARNLKLPCTSADVIAGSEITDATKGLVKVTFLGCETINDKTGVKMPCEVLDEVGVKDQINATAILLPKEHAGIKYVTFDEDGGPFALIKLSGVTCPIAGDFSVTGSVSAKLIVNLSVVDLIQFSQAFSELVGDSLKFGFFTAFLNGSGTTELTGAHTGLKFGVC
jgi:hypothetical protein